MLVSVLRSKVPVEVGIVADYREYLPNRRQKKGSCIICFCQLISLIDISRLVLEGHQQLWARSKFSEHQRLAFHQCKGNSKRCIHRLLDMDTHSRSQPCWRRTISVPTSKEPCLQLHERAEHEEKTESFGENRHSRHSD